MINKRYHVNLNWMALKNFGNDTIFNVHGIWNISFTASMKYKEMALKLWRHNDSSRRASRSWGRRRRCVFVTQWSCFTKILPQRWAAQTPCISSWVLITNCRLYSNIFHKYCCCTKREFKTNLTLITKSFGVCYWCDKIPPSGYMEQAWIKTYYVLCSKTYSAFGNMS